jgi:hypothetical protein
MLHSDASPLLNQALTHIEVDKLHIRKMERGDPMVAALLCPQVACPYGRSGRLSGEARLERRLRASVEVREGVRALWIA